MVDTHPALKKLVEFASRAKELATIVKEKEEALVDATKEHQQLVQREIPDYMIEMEISAIFLPDGTKVQLIEKYYGSITEAKKYFCFKWLRDNGHGDIIKRVFKVNFGMGDDELADKLTKFVNEEEMSSTQTTTVNAGTLKAFINECMTEGIDIDQELFSVFPHREVKFK